MTVVEGYPLLIIYDKDVCHFLLNKEFIWLLKTWSFGPGQSSSALPEESLQEFEVN